MNPQWPRRHLLNLCRHQFNGQDTARLSEVLFKQGFDKKYPKALFNYQQQINQSGNLEAYNHWLLSKGDADNFNTWQAANDTKWENFFSGTLQTR